MKVEESFKKNERTADRNYYNTRNNYDAKGSYSNQTNFNGRSGIPNSGSGTNGSRISSNTYVNIPNRMERETEYMNGHSTTFLGGRHEPSQSGSSYYRSPPRETFTSTTSNWARGEPSYF